MYETGPRTNDQVPAILVAPACTAGRRLTGQPHAQQDSADGMTGCSDGTSTRWLRVLAWSAVLERAVRCTCPVKSKVRCRARCAW